MKTTPSHSQILSVDAYSFEEMALRVFHLQAAQCIPYKSFLSHLGVNANGVKTLEQVPFLPIETFKHHLVYANSKPAEIVFGSSGTTGMQRSQHHVASLADYLETCVKGFELSYGALQEWKIIAILPSYQERSDSSLIAMVDHFFGISANETPCYMLGEKGALDLAREWAAHGTKVLIIGVTYALLDLAESGQSSLPDNVVVMETGGMKGRREEWTRAQIHETLNNAWGVSKVHSEYGMTELMSQAYSKGDGIFDCPPWMRLRIRDLNDPFSSAKRGKTGGINIIDLANLHSCSFIATQDLGRRKGAESFEILGRFDHADVRGCNLMVAE